MGVERPVTAREFRAVLTKLGFRLRSTSGSHEQWVRNDADGFRKVTLDVHNAPYARKLLGYMLRQAGLSKKDLWRLLDSL